MPSLALARKSKICRQADCVLGATAVAVAAATGAGLIGTTETASAEIVHSGPVNIVVPDNIDGVYMNVVTGATGTSAAGVPGYDINPYSAAAGLFNLWGPTTSVWLSAGGVIAGPYKLAPGTPIGPPDTNFFRPGGGTNVGLEMNLNSDQNLLGFRFTNELNANQIHYGWARFQFGATPGVRSITEYAYENVAGTAIGAGVVPEPSTLSLLALGAAGLMRRRSAR